MGTAETWERNLRLAPLCWQPALPIGRRDVVARESAQAESQTLAVGSHVGTHRKRCPRRHRWAADSIRGKMVAFAP